MSDFQWEFVPEKAFISELFYFSKNMQEHTTSVQTTTYYPRYFRSSDASAQT